MMLNSSLHFVAIGFKMELFSGTNEYNRVSKGIVNVCKSDTPYKASSECFSRHK